MVGRPRPTTLVPSRRPDGVLRRGPFGMLGISPLSPSLVEGFAPSRLEVALIVPSIYPGGLFFSPPGGQLADRFGVRTSLLGGPAIAAPGLLARA